jgi:alanine dehydrogenase
LNVSAAIHSIRPTFPQSVVRNTGVPVSIDQGGCFETSHSTTHEDPTYLVDGVHHYCVANMPGVVPATSTKALTNATLRCLIKLADLGMDGALDEDPNFAAGLDVANGKVTYGPVAWDQDLRMAV